MIRGDKELPYPRVCSHRGFNTIAPENSMPAFGAVIAMGAEEVQFIKSYYNEEMIVKAKEHGIVCNIF